MGVFTRIAETVIRDVPLQTRAPAAATGQQTYSQPGVPQMPTWNAQAAIDVAYYSTGVVQRAVTVLANAIASLPFRAGTDPSKPTSYNPNAPLARLLGPAPGGPNPQDSAATLWRWSLAQRIVTGKYAWELDRAKGTGPAGPIVGLWPLVPAALNPIPSSTPGQWFSGYEYKLAGGQRKQMTPGQVFYSWRPSLTDWRQPESALIAVAPIIQTLIALDRHTYRQAMQGFTGGTLIVTPPFDDAGDRRAWQDQMNSRYTGPDNAGRILFAEAEPGEDPSGKSGPVPQVQVSQLGQNQTDAQVVAHINQLEERILRDLGVPMSMVGDASGRTYANADQEHKNFWTGPVLELAREITDEVNLRLAPQLGSEVGWFDFSGVEALQRPPVFAQVPPSLQLIQAGLMVAEDWREDVGLPPLPGDVVLPGIQELPAVEDTPGAAAAGGSSGSSGGSGGGRSAEDPLERYATVFDDHDDDELDALPDSGFDAVWDDAVA